MIEFFKPYFLFCGSSTYSLIQNMESMGWVSFWKGIYIDPHSTFTVFFGIYVILLPLVAIINILASFALNRILGLLSLFIWMSPGVLSLIGIDLISKVDTPDSYILNSGSMYVGETKSTLFNVFVCFLLGWSLTTLLVHFLKISKSFKELYDHVWYVLGLAAAVIFVVDSNTAYYKSELSESEANISKTLSLITSQLNYSNSVCLSKEKILNEQGISGGFCEWVKKAEFNYFWLSEDKSFTRNLKSQSDFDALVPDEIISDVTKFNEFICSSKAESSNCNLLPFELGRFSEEFDWPHSRFALAIVPLNDALRVFWGQSSERNEKLESVKNVPNTKWFFYMLLGFIAGGKVANSSRSLAGNPEPVFRYWLAYIWQKLSILFVFVLQSFWSFFRGFSGIIRKIPFNKWLQRIQKTNR